MKYDYLIVGAGLFGSVFANRAKDAGKKVLVIDKRPHIGGNVYTKNTDGIDVHCYGAHIFHTNDDRVWDYVNRFSDFNKYCHSPKANYKGDIYSLPFNMNTFNEMWGVKTAEEAQKIIEEQQKEISGNIENLEQQAISLVGRDVYKRLIKGYTEKQWGRDCKKLPPFIIKRLPVRFTYDNNYFNAKYQGIPIDGYTKMVENMLDGIEVHLDEKFIKGQYDVEKIIYTGAIDEYFEYCLGALKYRSVYFENEVLDVPDFQNCSVVNYTDRKTPYTRIIEHKWFNFGKDAAGNDVPKTIISKEYSVEWKPGDEPYYPVNDSENNALYEKYRSLADNEKKVIFGGRLGEYKYYDMDKVIELALRLADEELEKDLTTV